MSSMEKTFHPGEVIIKEGHYGSTFFVINTGMVEVLKKKGGNLVPLTVLGPNEFFGEMSILDPGHGKRSATVRALEETTVTIMEEEDFRHYLGQLTPGVRRMLTKLAERLRRADQKIEELRKKEEDHPAGENLDQTLTLDELEKAREAAVDVHFITKKFRAGQVIVREGDVGQCGFIIKKGSLQVSKMVGEREVVLNTLGEHDTLGESALFDDTTRNATVKALTDGELMIFGKRDMIHMARKSPLELFVIMDSMSGKLDRMNEKYCQSLSALEDTRSQIGELAGRIAALDRKLQDLEQDNGMLRKQLELSRKNEGRSA